MTVVKFDVDQIISLSITSWGVSIGGEHFNVDASCKRKILRGITHPLSRKEAAYLNKKDRTSRLGKYKPGEMCSRFETREAAIEEGCKQAREKWPEAKLVLDGNWPQPCPVVWCSDKKIGAQLKKLSVKMEALYKKTNDPWADYREETKSLETEWDSVLDKFLPKKTKARKT